MRVAFVRGLLSPSPKIVGDPVVVVVFVEVFAVVVVFGGLEGEAVVFKVDNDGAPDVTEEVVRVGKKVTEAPNSSCIKNCARLLTGIVKP